MNATFRCENCGVKKPCILVMVDADEMDILEAPRVCVNGGKATWKLLS